MKFRNISNTESDKESIKSCLHIATRHCVFYNGVSVNILDIPFFRDGLISLATYFSELI
jgi:hypothetical protein